MLALHDALAENVAGLAVEKVADSCYPLENYMFRSTKRGCLCQCLSDDRHSAATSPNWEAWGNAIIKIG